MAQTLAYVHTVPSLIPLFRDLSTLILPPTVEILHIADEILLKVVVSQGGLSPFIFQRVAQHAAAAERAGANMVQLTCSSISPCAEPARLLVSIPVLKIDEPMVDRAVSIGSHIGIAATAPTTLKPTSELVYQRAATAGKSVEVEAVLCQGAYQALSSGDTETHDRIVRQAICGLMQSNDVVILAQASMARVQQSIPSEKQRVPILSSPRLAVERANQILAEMIA